MRAPVLVGISTILMFASSVLIPARSQAQHKPALDSVAKDTSAAMTESQVSEPNTVHILYTGKLLGYFRVPDWQGPAADGKGCDKPASQSIAANDFNDLLKTKFRTDRVRGFILVGTGDNFAPEIEARDFCSPPANQTGVRGPYRRAGKGLFAWDPSPNQKQWLTNEEVGQQDLNDPNTLRNHLARGEGIIPTDNVANFFVREGYAALVPGKHDFYFGPERLRELARYLASSKISNEATIHSDGVQMLGSNLVIETTWKSDHMPLPDKENPPWFIPRFPTAIDLIGQTDLEIKLSGLSDGGSVYPWFMGPTLQFSKPDVPDLLIAELRDSHFYLCEAMTVKPGSPNDPNSIPQPVAAPPCRKVLINPKWNGKTQQYQLLFPWEDLQHSSTVTPGKNYGLCVVAPNNVRATDNKGGHTFCERFSVYTPFFQYPWGSTGQACLDPQKQCSYRDPDPYVLVETTDPSGGTEDVAIFGVVDPHLGDYVGMLNMAWSNANRHYKTQTAVKDPAEALKELLACFDRRFREKYPDYEQELKDERKGNQVKRRLIKVLLAQMSPQEAQVLATRLGQFQVVVSAADPEMATVGDVTMTEWNRPPESPRPYPLLVAVPEPFYVAQREGFNKWKVDIGSLAIHLLPDPNGKWKVVSYHEEKQSDLGSPHVQAKGFWIAVNQRLIKDCLPRTFSPSPPAPTKDDQSAERADQIPLLTLCAMQDYDEADVALLQKRDFFPELPKGTDDIGDLAAGQDKSLQPILDRIIWKGDLLTLWYVPGSALQKVLEQSKMYDADDKSKLSLSDEKQRGLVTLGITFDPDRGEYVVNGLPLDPSKLYSVATSDFLGAGDTGYPDLAAAQVKPPVAPKDFDKTLRTISSIVCRQLAGAQANADCLDPLSNNYFDEMTASPTDTRGGNTAGKQRETWSVFWHPGPVPASKPKPPESTQKAADRAVEQRPLWDFNLVKWTLGITALDHSTTDFDVQNSFAGITAPGVNAFRSSTWTSDFQAQWTRYWQHNEIFVAPAYTYNVQYKGQPDDSRQINQVADLGVFDLGFVHLWKSGRGPEDTGSVFTAHFETPLTRSFTAFQLATNHTGAHGEPIKDQIRFALDRSYTEFLRAGFRWMRRKSSVEFGPEWGHEWNALEEIDFVTNGNVTACPATANRSIKQCVSDAARANPQAITPSSQVATKRLGHGHSGTYWKLNLTVPFHPNVSYVLTDTGDWFFVHYHTDNSLGTLFRDYSQHQLKFKIFPSFSIGPELDLLFYQNKTAGTLKGHFLRQDQVTMKAQFSFDLFNHRKVWKQIEYAPPQKSN